MAWRTSRFAVGASGRVLTSISQYDRMAGTARTSARPLWATSGMRSVGTLWATSISPATRAATRAASSLIARQVTRGMAGAPRQWPGKASMVRWSSFTHSTNR